ncbi:hypothetical protein [uncultured Erythrobacter sp.]|uniref:hypothetical protein n=1 Tax=uncultured Erythrobacter sp. TaxID=263913 RepID=UPI00262D12E1|nr:hypothetical protein [uncultured Erythrobacter sp.]
MHYFGWLIGGFVLLSISRFIERIGDFGATSADRLPVYFLAFGALLGAGYCFIKAGRGVWKALQDQFGNGPTKDEGPDQEVQPARRLADSEYEHANPITEFDADDALARYMARRDPEAPPNEISPTPIAPANPKPSGRPAFGRKIN